VPNPPARQPIKSASRRPAFSPTASYRRSPASMTKKLTSVPCSDTVVNACTGALVGTAAASVHHVYLALSSQVPEDVLAHVLGGTAAAAFGDAIAFAVGSVLYNRFKRRR
jgi:hypothetical protein